MYAVRLMHACTGELQCSRWACHHSTCQVLALHTYTQTLLAWTVRYCPCRKRDPGLCVVALPLSRHSHWTLGVAG